MPASARQKGLSRGWDSGGCPASGWRYPEHHHPISLPPWRVIHCVSSCTSALALRQGGPVDPKHGMSATAGRCVAKPEAHLFYVEFGLRQRFFSKPSFIGRLWKKASRPHDAGVQACTVTWPALGCRAAALNLLTCNTSCCTFTTLRATSLHNWGVLETGIFLKRRCAQLQHTVAEKQHCLPRGQLVRSAVAC